MAHLPQLVGFGKLLNHAKFVHALGSYVVRGEIHFQQILQDQNGVFPKLMYSWSALRITSTSRFSIPLGASAGAGARAPLSALSTVVGSGADAEALPSAL